MKKKWTFDQPQPADDYFWHLTREDLDPEEQAIYDNTLPRLVDPDAERLRMLAAYAWAASELKKAAPTNNLALTTWLRKCMIYARNGLGIGGVHFIDMMELLLNCNLNDDWPPVELALDPAWQLPYTIESKVR